MKKTILITGAAGNLGTAVSKNLLTNDYQVIGTLAPGHQAPNDHIDFRTVDLEKEEATSTFFEDLQTQYDALHGVVCLVGGFGMSNIQNATSSELMKMLQLNLMTAFHTAHFAYNWMKKTGGGKLIFVGAKPALEGGASEVLPYAISKSGVIKLAEIINETGNKDQITASVIVPSIIDTPPNRSSMPDANFDDWVTPEAIAENISFLFSDAARPLRKSIFRLYGNS